MRYQFYREIASKYNTNEVVLFDHLDDAIENIVMQLQRITKGYLGLKM
ncbi:MAG: ATP-binding protein [Coprobacillus cateniformis]